MVNESDHVDWKRRSSLKCVNNTISGIIVVRFGKFSAAVEKGRCYVCEMLPPCRHCGHYCMGWASVRDDGPNELCLAYQVVRRATAAMQLAEIAGGPETEVTQEWLRYATQTAATMAKIAAREAQENRRHAMFSLRQCPDCGAYCKRPTLNSVPAPDELCRAYWDVSRATMAIELAEMLGDPEVGKAREWLRRATRMAAVLDEWADTAR